MGRAKKISVLPGKTTPRSPIKRPLIEEIETEPDQPGQIPTVTEVHSVNRRWIEKRKLDEIPTDDSEDLLSDDDGPMDPIAEVVYEIGLNQSTWAMHVYRLPNYPKDQATHPKARSFVGTLTIPDADFLLQDLYLQEIQEKFAKIGIVNTFLLVLRRNNRLHLELPPVTVEAAAVDPAKNGAQIMGLNGLTVYNQPGEDPIKIFAAQVKQIAQIRDSLFPPELVKQMTGQTQQNNPPMTAETAAIHLLNQDGTVIDTLLGKLKDTLKRSDGAHEPTFMDVVMAAIQHNTLPNMLQKAREIITDILQVKNGSISTTPPQTTAPGTSAPVAEKADGNHQPHQASNPSTIAHPPEIILLNFAIHQCAYNAPPAPVAEWIVSFEDQNPSVRPFLDMFLEMAPLDALAWLSSAIPESADILKAPHAESWVKAVQAEIKSRSTDAPAA